MLLSLCILPVMFCLFCLLFSLGLFNRGYIETYNPLGLARGFLHDDAGWSESMASNNRVFPSIHAKTTPLSKIVGPISIARLFCFCYGFIAISVLALPLVLLVQFLALHCVGTQLCFLPLFAHMHHFAKSVRYVTAELLKRIPLGVIFLVRYKHFVSTSFIPNMLVLTLRA